MEHFSLQARNWTLSVNNTDFDNPLAVRMLNDQIMELDRVLVLPGGLPFQNGTRNGVFGPRRSDIYGGRNEVFPGISDLLADIDDVLTIEEKQRRYEMLRKHITELMVAVHQAASHLKPFHAI